MLSAMYAILKGSLLKWSTLSVRYPIVPESAGPPAPGDEALGDEADGGADEVDALGCVEGWLFFVPHAKTENAITNTSKIAITFFIFFTSRFYC
jgi:hypothetical protein